MSRHLLLIAAIGTLALLMILRPFLPGMYDPLAEPLSTALQLVGVAGVPVALLAIVWLCYEVRLAVTSSAPGRGRFHLAVATLVVATGLWGITGVIVLMGLSATLGALAFAVMVLALRRLVPAVGRFRSHAGMGVHPAPLYLTLLPVLLVGIPLLVARPVTAASRARAIRASTELIDGIEAHRRIHGSYPTSLFALNVDYLVGVAGVPAYEYSRRDEAYNLGFLQPRFFLDDLGVREYVVFNPRDQHVVMSHVAWILEWSSEVQETRQGWFESRAAGPAHWKSFLFD